MPDMQGNGRNIQVKDPNGVVQALKGGRVFDYIQRTERTSWKLDRPLGQNAMDMAVVHIAQAMVPAKKAPVLDKGVQSTVAASL